MCGVVDGREVVECDTSVSALEKLSLGVRCAGVGRPVTVSRKQKMMMYKLASMACILIIDMTVVSRDKV